MNDINALLPHIKLKFNVEHPGFEECYLFGYECAKSELGENENPFKDHSSEALQWQEGWWAGFYGEEPLFKTSSPQKDEKMIHEAANDQLYQSDRSFLSRVLKITGALAASAVVGYQVIDLVA